MYHLSTHLANSTWGVTSERTIIRGNVHAMKKSDAAMLLLTPMVVSFCLADEVRDIKLYEITIQDRGGSQPWQPSRLQWAALLGFPVAWVFLLAVLGLLEDNITASDILLSGGWVVGILGIITRIDYRDGNSPCRIFLLALNALRRFMVIPMLAATVATLMRYDSSNAQDMALNSVGGRALPADPDRQ